VSNIGLVLSGGMAKGAYQIGALQAINEFLKPSDFKYVAASSIGVLNSYAYLTNGLDKAIDLWSRVNNKSSRAWVTTLLKSSFMLNAIEMIASDERITNSFYIPLVNIKKRTLFYTDLSKVPQENIELYLRASVAMPVYNTGVVIDGEQFFDGAMIDNIPVYPISKHHVDYIICIYFDDYNYTFENEYLDNKIIKLNFFDKKIISSSICLDGDSVKYMIEEGYKHSKRLLEYVFAKGTDDVDSIYARIEDLNAMHGAKNFRITGDIVVNNMNKITQKLIRKKIIL